MILSRCSEGANVIRTYAVGSVGRALACSRRRMAVRKQTMTPTAPASDLANGAFIGARR